MQMRAEDKFSDLIVAVSFPQGPSEFFFFFLTKKRNSNHRAVGLHASLTLIFIYVWNQRGIKPQFVLRKTDGEPWLANWNQSSVGLIRQGMGAERPQMSGSSGRTDGRRPPPGTVSISSAPELWGSNAGYILSTYSVPGTAPSPLHAVLHWLNHHSPIKRVELVLTFYSDLEVQRSSVARPRSTADKWRWPDLNLHFWMGIQER